jgi:hypothetical protein
MTSGQSALSFAALMRLLASVSAAVVLVATAPERASAWDAGTNTRVSDAGSGGENPIAILDTRPKWAQSTETNSSRVSDCPSGYTNTGVSCYREDFIYSAPSLLASCPSGYTNTGVSCYREDFVYSAPSLLASCPSGYTNTGVSCFRGDDTYSAPSKLASCTSGGTNFGTFCFPSGSFYCSSGYFVNSSIGRCYVSCPAGYTNTGEFCERYASTISLSNATCPAGYFKGAIASRCNKNCDPGFTNTGEFCDRPADSISLSNATCPTGYFKGLIASRCNKNCDSGFTNTGEFCDRPADSISLSNATCPAGYFKGLIASRCNETCDSGFTNTGEFCDRPADSLSTSSMTCTSGEEKIDILGVPRCYTKPVCPTGYAYFDLLCYVAPVATGQGGSVDRTAVSTVVHHVKQSGNTHLWIVEQALALLAKSDDPRARAFAAKMQEPAIQAQWEQGLWDGDSPTYVDFDSVGSANNHQGTHFYNAAGLDRSGDPTAITTYYGATDNKFESICTNSRECAAYQLGSVTGYALGETNPQTSKAVAYHLGVALHYMTDATQPMHTSGWYGASIPINGHPQWEYYVPYVQALFPATSLTWDKRWASPSVPADTVFYNSALTSNGFAPGLANALHIDGASGIVTIQAFNGIGPYTGFNFYDDIDVDALTGQILEDAYQSTASYLYAVARDVVNPCDADADSDGICDDVDDCTLAANPGQVDADSDGYGNACDPDFNEDNVVNFMDLARMKSSFFSSDGLTDLNGDGFVNFGDLAILKKLFFKRPGPSGLACAGEIPCPVPPI